jgi:hypothetical protein
MLTKETPYFSHDANASHDPKIVRAENNFGDIAYCWFFKTLELLRQERNLKLLLSDIDILYPKVKCPSAQMYSAFIKTSNLFDFNETHFWSNSLIARVGNALLSSSKKSKAANMRWGKFYLDNGNNEKAMAYFSLAEISDSKQPDVPALPPANHNPQQNNETISPAIIISEKPKTVHDIILPLVPFQLTHNAELSWKACLFMCNKSYEEIKAIHGEYVSEEIFESYKRFNSIIDNPNNEPDLRPLRISNFQVDLQSFVKLCKPYADRAIIIRGMIKMLGSGLKPEHVLSLRIPQFIGYILDEGKEKGSTSTAGKSQPDNAAPVLKDGYYWANNKKIMTINIEDMEQCRQLIKIKHDLDLSDEEIIMQRTAKGDQNFTWWLEL